MVLPFYDYCDIIWGDRNSRALMDSLQVLHNKIVLNRPVHSSSTQALIDLSIGGSIFGFDGAFIGLSIFLNALKHWPCKLHFFNNLPQSQNKKILQTVKSEIYFEVYFSTMEYDSPALKFPSFLTVVLFCSIDFLSLSPLRRCVSFGFVCSV